LATEKKELRLVADQITCPTYAGEIASVIFSLIKSQCRGTYHFCSENPVSWYQFALDIIEQARLQRSLAVENIIPITTADYKTAAKRPPYSVLDCSKLKNDTGMTQPNLQAGIAHALIGLSHDDTIPTS